MIEDKANRKVLFVIFIFAITGIMTAIQGRSFLSGIFALYFVGYFIIRLRYFLGRPFPKIPDSILRLGYILPPVAFVIVMLYLVLGNRL